MVLGADISGRFRAQIMSRISVGGFGKIVNSILAVNATVNLFGRRLKSEGKLGERRGRVCSRFILKERRGLRGRGWELIGLSSRFCCF